MFLLVFLMLQCNKLLHYVKTDLYYRTRPCTFRGVGWSDMRELAFLHFVALLFSYIKEHIGCNVCCMIWDVSSEGKHVSINGCSTMPWNLTKKKSHLNRTLIICVVSIISVEDRELTWWTFQGCCMVYVDNIVSIL